MVRPQYWLASEARANSIAKTAARGGSVRSVKRGSELTRAVPGTCRLRLANAEPREWKEKLHAALEPMAVTKARRDAISTFEARAKGYRWLANALQIDEKACTIHQLDPDQCRAAVGVIEQFGRSRLDHAPSE